MAKTSGTPFKTLQNWWSAFCRETGLSITPRQASDERKAFAAEVGRLILKLKENSHQDEIPNGNDRWLLELGDKSGMGKSSVYRWWSAFAKKPAKTGGVRVSTTGKRQRAMSKERGLLYCTTFNSTIVYY